MLKKLNLDDTTIVETKENVVPDGAGPNLNVIEDEVEGNPVGKLSEFCFKNQIPPPLYECQGEEGQPHQRIYQMDCVVGEVRISGSGRSKKMAKKKAAAQMLDKVKDLTMEEIDKTLKQMTINEVIVRLPNKVKPESKLSKLNEICLNPLDVGNVQLLENIGNDEGFSVEFGFVKSDPNPSCLVQLSLNPVVVCYGSGKDPEEAKLASTFAALKYLMVLCQQDN